MAKRLILMLAMAMVLASPVAAAKQGGCTIDPNPIVYGTLFTITAQLQPLKAYDYRIDQDDQFGHHDDGTAWADSTGLVTIAKWALNNDPRDGLTVGVFSVHIKPSSEVPRASRGSGGASCSGEIIP